MADQSAECLQSVLPEEAKEITKELLEDGLRRSEHDDTLRVESFELSEAIRKGDSVLGNLLSVKVNTSSDSGTGKVHHLFAKIDFAPENSFGQFTRESEFFIKEIKAYTVLFPATTEYQLDTNQPLTLTISVPRIITTKTDKISLLIMEDLRHEGYQMGDIRKGLDFDHCYLAMSEIAKFHALSFAVKFISPGIFKEKFKFAIQENAICKRFIDRFAGYYELTIDVAIELAKLKICNAEIVKQTTRMKDVGLVELFERQLFLDEPFATICWRDSICRNMLYKYEISDSGTPKRPKGIKLVDFQTICYSMPVFDLAMFIYTSTTRALRQARLDDLLLIYYKALQSHLNQLEVPLQEYSYELFMKHFNRARKLRMLSGIVGLPLLLLTPEDSPSMAGDVQIDLNFVLDALQRDGRFVRVTDLLTEAADYNLTF